MGAVDEISQAERRRIMREATTYHSAAEASIDKDRGGRFKVLTPTTVVGRSSVAYPKLPAAAPSNQAALTADEPPLGYSVDALDPVGEPHERIEAKPQSSERRRGWRRL